MFKGDSGRNSLFYFKKVLKIHNEGFLKRKKTLQENSQTISK